MGKSNLKKTQAQQKNNATDLAPHGLKQWNLGAQNRRRRPIGYLETAIGGKTPGSALRKRRAYTGKSDHSKCDGQLKESRENKVILRPKNDFPCIDFWTTNGKFKGEEFRRRGNGKQRPMNGSRWPAAGRCEKAYYIIQGQKGETGIRGGKEKNLSEVAGAAQFETGKVGDANERSLAGRPHLIDRRERKIDRRRKKTVRTWGIVILQDYAVLANMSLLEFNMGTTKSIIIHEKSYLGRMG